MVMESYSSVIDLNFFAINCQEIKTPTISPSTIQKALRPITAPIPVTPRSSQPDSPVDLAESAAIQ